MERWLENEVIRKERRVPHRHANVSRKASQLCGDQLTECLTGQLIKSHLTAPPSPPAYKYIATLC
ncbi:hypothetical protein J6590_044939 [Homalodisca vitripennis]|nr:hypothetical protein J6590_044939 [Homalodisca vitripennis]